MTKDDLIALARQTAKAHGLDDALVCAVVEQESGWNPWAIKYEPDFFKKYVAPLWTANKVTNMTELQSRAFSWGLMQLMGQCAREDGFPDSEQLSWLCDPAIGLQWGCKHLAHKIAVARGVVKQGLLFWNGGGNKNYADEVFARIPTYQVSNNATEVKFAAIGEG